MRALARPLATWFYCGYAPKAPGTAGSLAALALAWLLARYAGLGPLGIAFLGAVLTGPAIWAAGVTARETGLKDPQIVVVDEVVGQWITFAGVTALNWKSWVAAFILFRAFDILKASAGSPIGAFARRNGHRAGRCDGRRVCGACVVCRRMVQSLLAPLFYGLL